MARFAHRLISTNPPSAGFFAKKEIDNWKIKGDFILTPGFAGRMCRKAIKNERSEHNSSLNFSYIPQYFIFFPSARMSFPKSYKS